MAVTLKQIEGMPDSYPDLDSPSRQSDAAAALDPAVIWQRIESYVARRWTVRDVTWIVEGPGEWCPPLSPTTFTNIEVWSSDGEWEATMVDPAPTGYWLPASGPYRFSGVVGDVSPFDEAPPLVQEAYRRLAEYFVTHIETPDARSETTTIGSLTVPQTRSSSWMAEALHNSGAADLLRSYRRA